MKRKNNNHILKDPPTVFPFQKKLKFGFRISLGKIAQIFKVVEDNFKMRESI
jgi:hypothetical protein